MTEETTQLAEDKARQKHRWRLMDAASIVSFTGAIGLGLLSLASNIRTSFYNNFVLGYRESPTFFSHIFKKYTGPGGEFAKNTIKNKNDPKAYEARAVELAGKLRGEINKELLKFGVESEGWRGWAIGTCQRWNKMRGTAKINNSVAFASLALTAVGSVFLLARSRSGIDEMGARLDKAEHGASR